MNVGGQSLERSREHVARHGGGDSGALGRREVSDVPRGGGSAIARKDEVSMVYQGGTVEV